VSVPLTTVEPVSGLSPRTRARLAGEILGAYVRVRWLIWRKDLPEAAATLRAGEGSRSPGGPVNPWHLAGATIRVLSLLPTDSRCLMRSLVLLHLLSQRGVHSTLVVGVTTEPEFAAHAWVEREGQAVLPTGGGRFRRLTEV